MTATLDVFIRTRLAGTITSLPGNLSLFVFDEAYIADPDRPVLSQSYLDTSADRIERHILKTLLT
jgi:serine/threonine-protein kinase HipA